MSNVIPPKDNPFASHKGVVIPTLQGERTLAEYVSSQFYDVGLAAFSELVARNAVEDRPRNLYAAYMIVIAAMDMPNSQPISWHRVAIEDGVKPAPQEFHVMQAVSHAINECRGAKS